MTKYELNGLGKDWIFEAESKYEATQQYLRHLNLRSYEEYIDYCEEASVRPMIIWDEVK